jgi:PPOX class probable F420-dependent enzyme
VEVWPDGRDAGTVSTVEMPYRPMSDDRVRAFLTAMPARPAILATTRADGRPHVAPVWYAVDDDGTIVFNTGETTVKGRNLRRSGYAAMSVDDDAPPFSFVTVEGPVTISDDLADVRHWAGVIGGRYMGADRAEEYGERNGVAGELVVRLEPVKVVSAFAVAD